MRILLLNPNTTVAATDAMAVLSRQVASPGTEVVPLTAPRGPPYIVDAAQHEAAGGIVVDMLRQHVDRCDAVVIAAFTDSGLEAARTLSPVPVVGICEAACLVARGFDGRYSVVTSAPDLVALMRRRIEDHGLADRLASVRSSSASRLGDGDTVLLDVLTEAAGVAVRQDGARAIVIGGGPLSSLQPRLRARLGIPVIDGVTSAVRYAEMLRRFA
ncbi:MAG: aspartate/glutamate racemase family protein [Alphaproteobacteria bacterium]